MVFQRDYNVEAILVLSLLSKTLGRISVLENVGLKVKDSYYCYVVIISLFETLSFVA